MPIKHNVGETDRWVRIILGAVLAITGYMVASWLWEVVGLMVFATGVAKWCPIYKTFKMSTCNTEEATNTEEKNKE